MMRPQVVPTVLLLSFCSALGCGGGGGDGDEGVALHAPVRGTVRDGTGAAVPGTCVSAVEPRAGTVVQRQPAETGGYVFERLPAGEYELVVEDCTVPFTWVEGRQAVDGAALNTVDVVVEDVVVEEGGSIAGALRAAHNGAALPSSCLAARVVGGDALVAPSEEAARPGRYVFAGLPAGPWEVVGAEECEGGFDTAFVGAPIVLDPGDALVDNDVELVPLSSNEALCTAAAADAGAASAEEGSEVELDPDDVHAPAIECLADLGIAEGRSDGSFARVTPLERGRLASFLARGLAAVGVQLDEEPEDAFVDDDGGPHELALNRMAGAGVFTGDDAGRVGPDVVVRRRELAVALVRAYEIATGLELLPGDDHFDDDEALPEEADIDRAATAGLVVGTDGRTFDPDLVVERDQAATLLTRFLDRVQRDGVVSQPPE